MPATQAVPPEEAIARLTSQLSSDLQSELIDRIRTLSPRFLENLVLRLVMLIGFGGPGGAGEAVHLGRSGDDGMDGVISQDALGIDRVYIQAKRYRDGNPVGASGVRDFFGALEMARATKGVFLTTSKFTEAARETAARPHHRIVLIDGDRLAQLMIRYDVGVRIERTFPIKKIDEVFFLDERAPRPRCATEIRALI